MKISRFYTAVLTILGIQLPSCYVQDDAYGCPYADFNVYGHIKDTEGNTIEDASIKLEFAGNSHFSNEEPGTTYNHPKEEIATTKSNDRGAYIIKKTEPYKGNFRLITQKEGYKADTTDFEVKSNEYINKNSKDDWYEGALYKQKDITLQNKDKR